MQDMAPFLILLGVVILGWMFFFVICDPFSSAFGYYDEYNSSRPLWPVATMLLASMGNPISTVGSGDFDSWPALSMLCFFLFFVFIIIIIFFFFFFYILIIFFFFIFIIFFFFLLF